MSKHYFIDCSGQAHDWLYVSRDGRQPVKITADQAAAAPEMLEALQLVLKVTTNTTARKVIEDAIAKAEEK